MARQQIDLYPVGFGPIDMIETTEDEDLSAYPDMCDRRPPHPRIARALRRLEAVALTAAVLTGGVVAMAHGPTRTPSSAAADQRAVRASATTRDPREKALMQAERQREAQSAYLAQLLASRPLPTPERPRSRCAA